MARNGSASFSRRDISAWGLSTLLSLILTGVTSAQIAWQTDIEQARQLAARENRLLLFHFWNQNCAPCMRLEAAVFSRPEVARTIASGYVPVKINTLQSPDVARHFGIRTIPTDVILTPEGKVLHRDTSPQDPRQFTSVLNRVVSSGTGSTGISQAVAMAEGPPAPGAATQTPGGMTAGQGFEGPQYGPRPGHAPPAPPGIPGVQAPPGGAAGWGRGQSPAGEPSAGYAPETTPDFRAETVAPRTEGGPPSSMKSFQPHGPAAEAPPTDAGTPPGGIAMDGYCPVTLLEEEKWEAGDARFGAVHRQRTYIFAGAAQQQRFLQDPVRYSPVLSGFDPVRYADAGLMVSGKREHGVFYKGQIYLFADETSLESFWTAPQRYSEITMQAMYGPGQNPRR